MHASERLSKMLKSYDRRDGFLLSDANYCCLVCENVLPIYGNRGCRKPLKCPKLDSGQKCNSGDHESFIEGGREPVTKETSYPIAFSYT